MATIVEDTRTGKTYVLLGAGLAAWASSTPNAFLGNWMPNEKSGTLETLCVCDADGRVDWLGSEHVRIVSVDGRTPGEVLSQGATGT